MSPQSYEIQRATEQLNSRGYFSMANFEYAKEYVAALKFQFPEVALVHGIGDYNVGQFIFIPKGRRTVLSLIRRQLKEAEVSVEKCRKAVETLTEAAAKVA